MSADTENFTRRPKIYVAGPMTGSGDPYRNVAEALRLATALWDAGWCPIVPHTSSLWAMVGAPFAGAEWLTYDFQLLTDCDAMARLPGVSPGADQEEGFSQHFQKPIYPLPADWESRWALGSMVPEPGQPVDEWLMHYHGVVA